MDAAAAGGFITMLHVLAAFAPHAFYLPGVAPKEYQEGDAVQVKVNKLSSAVTQLPFDYYRLPHCRPAELVNMVENLGEVLHGSMIQNSAYELQMGKSDFKVLCKKDLTKREAWMIMNCADTNNDKVMTFDEFKRMMQMVRLLIPSMR